MRYVSAFLFATAAASHTAALANALGLAVLIAAGVLCLAFAIEAMINDALNRMRDEASIKPVPQCVEANRIADAELRRMFDQPSRTDKRV